MVYMSWLKQLYRFLSPKFQNAFLDYKVSLKPRYGFGCPVHAGLNHSIAKYDADYISLLQSSLKYNDQLAEIKELSQENDPSKPGWNNKFLPGLDIIMLYTIIADFKPKNYIEVGSGNSTKVVYKAKKDLQLNTKITSIDPYPRAEIDALADEIIRSPFETIDLSIMDCLEAGDVVFIDNSHRILPNSDANVFFMDVLPRLKKGVIVHVHDVYLPYDYPQDMCDRLYNEQYGLAYYIMANPEKYKTLMPCYYCSQNQKMADIVASLFDNPTMMNVERHGGSFYLIIG
jgi:predicted O-methyltransferase YrrM